MDSIEYNNRERVRAFGNAPASEMSIRTKIAVDITAAMVVATTGSYALMEEDLDVAIALADKLIKKLNENG
jgi:hypothetical protein